VELERIELSPSRLKVERLTIRPQFQKLGAPGWNRTNCLTIKNRLLILMSFERMVLALGVNPGRALIWSEAVYKSAGAPYTTPAQTLAPRAGIEPT
jgi:hypothetical protein